MEQGIIKGIMINETWDKQLLFQFFADDTTMFLEMIKENFLAAREAISLYEQISRAKLNLDKSTLVVMDDSQPPG